MLQDRLKCITVELQAIQEQITNAQQAIVDVDSVDKVSFVGISVSSRSFINKLHVSET